MTDRSISPLVGIPARLDPGGERQYVIRDYSEAVRVAGGIPIALPLLEDPEAFRPMAEMMDGVLLTGADTDVDPQRYGAARHECCGMVQPLHDKLDFFLLECARRGNLPVLAICFGIQSLNVFEGGTLIQDIPTEIGASIPHSVPESDGRPCHAIRIEPGSLLEDLAGGTRAEVNSTHHQAIRSIGGGLSVLARSSDGIVEAVGSARCCALPCGEKREQWILGVQWHPEKSFAYDKFSKNIFDAFLAECRARR